MTDKDIPAVSAVVCDCYNWLAQMEGFTAEETTNLIKERGSQAADNFTVEGLLFHCG